MSLGIIDGNSIRKSLDIDGAVNLCSTAYKVGTYTGVVATSVMGPAARLSYVRQVRTIPTIATTAEEAVGMRNMFKANHRRPLNWLLGRWHSSTIEDLRKTKTDAEIIAGAGRANKTWTNGIVALGVPVGAVNSAIKHDKLENMCGCQ